MSLFHHVLTFAVLRTRSLVQFPPRPGVWTRPLGVSTRSGDTNDIDIPCFPARGLSLPHYYFLARNLRYVSYLGSKGKIRKSPGQKSSYPIRDICVQPMRLLSRVITHGDWIRHPSIDERCL
ncbi:hypothetical protein LZ32DRAFT_403944 [Colletotrichum eremochloae]|nr:hypothetical protein LZ32DRAFT_403944 [Colletotrichum eremochloae]